MGAGSAASEHRFPAPVYHEDMRAYIIRRLLLIVPTLFILSILVFLSVRFIPGDVIDTIVAKTEFFGAVDREALVRMLGLDVPVYVQYGRWIGVLPTLTGLSVNPTLTVSSRVPLATHCLPAGR